MGVKLWRVELKV